MKRIITILAGSAVICSLALARDESSEFKKFMAATLPKAKKAFNSKDLKFFETTAAPDFVEKSMGKTVNRQQSMANMKQMFAGAKSMNCWFELQSASAKGGVGIAMTHSRMTAIMNPMKKGDKKTHAMKGEGWTKMTWVKMGKTWKLKMIEDAKPSKMTMDGKPFDPSKMGGG